ncbi:gasdermin-C-like [Phyllostomus hastatus]|uniref:gasdermin-C-like n=1 Tax=Phyllostomus hastatus TaxID=9423 RepID=UPI001E682659|nr:gasdermin-C-like [Phyllostomus hastatus]
MPSMFESAVKKLVKEIGDKEFRPVIGITNADTIRRFSLIRRKKSFSLFWTVSDVPLRYTLKDVLEPSVIIPVAAVETPYTFHYTESWKQHTGASVNAGADVSVSAKTSSCQGSSISCMIVSTPPETLIDLQKRKVVDSEPPFLKQCRRTGTNLYVVTEVIELRDSCVMEDCSTVNISGTLSLLVNAFAKVGGGGRVHQVSKRKHTVPKGLVMAYKRKQLVFKGNSWEIVEVSDVEEETFPVEMQYQTRSLTISIPLVPGNTVCFIEPIQRIQEPPLTDFKRLQQEVSREVSAVDQFSKDIEDVVFSNILAMLGNREALQDLMDTLEQEPLQGHLDGPGGTILNELQKDSSYAYNGSQHLILYLLEAIMALSDIQHCLLAQSMEKKILSQQRDLVRSILEPNFKYPWSIPFTLKPELLAPLQGEGLAITYGLLEECGLKMELQSPRSTWDLGAKKPLSALYGALSVLQRLAEA